MNNRKLETITVISFQDGVDAYGQKRQTQSGTRTIEGYVYLYSNLLVDNPKFNDCDYIVLTKDRSVKDHNQVSINSVVYDVMYVIPSFRYNLLFLRKS